MKLLLCLLFVFSLSGCATPPAQGPPVKDIYAPGTVYPAPP